VSVRSSSPETLTCRRAVSEALANLEPGSTVLVACSGGPDSLALVATSAWVGSRVPLEVSAIVVDHAIQSDSAVVAADAAATCERLGLPASVVTVEVGAQGGPEAAARAARYAALQEAAADAGAAAVLLGHTLEDQAETVLLRLARGSGARSLAAMSAHTGLWRRPFLDLPRSTVRATADEALARIDRSAWADPHNDDPAFSRVRVRGVLPLLDDAVGGGAVLGLARTAALLRDDADALDAIASREFDRIVSDDAGTCSADCGELILLPAALRTRVLRAMALASGAPADAVGFDHVRTLDAFVTDWHGQAEASLPGGVRAERSCGRLCLHSSSADRRSIGGA
jgi:tRNA(Ile)-lysidine synthase